MINRKALLIFVGLAFVTPQEISAKTHPGGLDAQGCHAGSKPYHCHRAASSMTQTQGGRNRLKCSEGSRSKECISLPKKGSDSPNNISTKKVDPFSFGVVVQNCKALITKLNDTYENGKCVGLVMGFMDGVFITSTIYADDIQKKKLGFCVPDNISNYQLATALVSYGEDHPEWKHKKWSLVFTLALRKTFPCID